MGNREVQGKTGGAGCRWEAESGLASKTRDQVQDCRVTRVQGRSQINSNRQQESTEARATKGGGPKYSPSNK